MKGSRWFEFIGQLSDADLDQTVELVECAREHFIWRSVSSKSHGGRS